jgi:hypothetical protein
MSGPGEPLRICLRGGLAADPVSEARHLDHSLKEMLMKTRCLASTLAAGVTLALASQAHAAAGWQDRIVVSIPQGSTDFFYHIACPAANPVAVSGGFLPNLAAKPGMVVLGNGPRLDVQPPSYNEWSWIFDWPNGAPAGAQIELNVYCKKA